MHLHKVTGKPHVGPVEDGSGASGAGDFSKHCQRQAFWIGCNQHADCCSEQHAREKLVALQFAVQSETICCLRLS